MTDQLFPFQDSTRVFAESSFPALGASNPTASQLVELMQDTEVSPLFGEFSTLGRRSVDHFEPSHDSMNVRSVPGPERWPTATQKDDFGHDTLHKMKPLGLEATDHLEPSQDSMRFLPLLGR